MEKYIGLELTGDVYEEIKTLFHPDDVFVCYPGEEDELVYDVAYIRMSAEGGVIQNISPPTKDFDMFA
jgi:hypothetical protein